MAETANRVSILLTPPRAIPSGPRAGAVPPRSGPLASPVGPWGVVTLPHRGSLSMSYLISARLY